MNPPDFLPALLTLFKETFEGVEPGKNSTWFVQGKEGIFDALASTSAKQASMRLSPNSNSIAAHVNHIRYSLRLANSENGGAEPGGTWESSWDVQEMSEQEWAQAERDIREEYEKVSAWLRANDDWSDKDTFTYALSLLPHMAYHLGAIRQLIRALG